MFLLIIAYPVYKSLNVPPTCYDGLQNQREAGIDCGGSCQFLCKIQVEDPVVFWARSFRVSPEMYDAVVSVQNPNFYAKTAHIGYTMTLYDADGAVLATREGKTYMNARDKFAIFESNIAVGVGKAVTKTTLEFKDGSRWTTGVEQDTPLIIKDKKLFDTNNAPRLRAILVNSSIHTVTGIDIIAFIYDINNTMVGVSATYSERLEGESSDGVSFSWQEPFTPPPSEGCTVPVDTMLVFDRSGSMDDDGGNPPQPISNAKDAARTFVDGVLAEDRVGLVSFATTPSNPIDQPLTFDHEAVKSAIGGIHILSGGTQYTNLGDAIKSAYGALTSSEAVANRVPKKAIIALTDGIASSPTDPNDEMNEAYPELYAARIAADIRLTSDVSLYVIGLGNDVNDEYLKGSIASSPNYYYKAATSGELKDIYHEIASTVCREGVYITDIVIHAREVSSSN